jgi:hypothetical protein
MPKILIPPATVTVHSPRFNALRIAWFSFLN